MRKFVLVAAMVLASASAEAGPSRNLSTGPGQNQQVAATADQARTAEVATVPQSSQSDAAPASTDQSKPADAPKYIHRPPAVEATTMGEPPQGQDRLAPRPGRRPAGASADAAHAGMAQYRRHHWTAGRIIAALHRYGIYW